MNIKKFTNFFLVVLASLLLCYNGFSESHLRSNLDRPTLESDFGNSNDSDPNRIVNIADDVVAVDDCSCSVYTDGCTVTLSGLLGSDYIKLLNNTNFSIEWSCNSWTNGGCNPTETITGLPNGTYLVQGCGSNQTIIITGCGTSNPCDSNGGDSDGDGVCDNQDCQPTNNAYPATPGTACNDGNSNTENDVVTSNGCGCLGTPVGAACSVTTSNCSITIAGMNSSDYNKVFNSSWQIVWECNPWINGGCNNTDTISNLENGTYHVQACGVITTHTVSGCNTDPYADQRPVNRTIDGTLNNFDHPGWGVIGAPLFRAVPSAYGDGVNSLAGPNRPNPRHISNQLSDEPQDRRDERLLSGMAYQFGQFVDHDFVLTEGSNEPAHISVPSYDPIFTPNGIIPFTRTAAIPGSSPRQQANTVTSYIDASGMYGSEPARAAWLRTFQDGKLKTSAGNLLPYNTIDGEFDSPTDINAPRMERDMQGGSLVKLFVAGDFRANEHPNLTSLHTVFMREHNRLCDKLKSIGMTGDEVIYQKARKIVGAVLQRIVYHEYIPAFGVSLSAYSGYKPHARAEIRNSFATAAYRWHTMVENDIILRNDQCEGIGPVELPLKTIFNNPSIIRKFGPGVLMTGLVFHPQYRTDIKVNNGLRNFLFGPGQGLDLVSINLQRGRDHGLPDYKTVRQHYGLGSISSFSQINSDYEVSSRLQRVYGNVNDIDLWSGIFSEPLVSGTSLPATAIAILKEQFEALRDGDAYFYKNDPALSSSDLTLINSSSLKNVIERNTSSKNLPSNVFFKPPCDDSDPLEDLNDHEGKEVCSGTAAIFITSCNSSSGTSLNVGSHSNSWLGNISKIKVSLGFGVRLYNAQNKTVFYTDDINCLPSEWQDHITAVDVICLSDDPSTVDCTGFAGALFSTCWSSPLPIFTPGLYNTEQLKSLAVLDDDVEGVRVNNGFEVELFEHDNFGGTSQVFHGPSVICLSYNLKNKVSSMKVTCLSDPDFSNCGFNGVAGAVFENKSPFIVEGPSEPNSHIGASVGVGDYTWSRLSAMGLKNDDIEKVSVNNGYAITLFQQDSFQGNHIVFLGDESHHPSSKGLLDNEASSMKVRCIESLQSSNLIADSFLEFIAKKKEEKAKLDITYTLSKDAIYQSIEKYDGRSGNFEILHDFIVESRDGSYTFYDEDTQAGDNIYRVIVHYADGTQNESPLRTVRFNKADHFNVYPNPATAFVNVDLENYVGMDVEVIIYDLRGVKLIAEKLVGLGTPVVSFNLSNTPPGTYVVRVIVEGKKSVSKKFSIIKN
jgi:peroxidase